MNGVTVATIAFVAASVAGFASFWIGWTIGHEEGKNDERMRHD